MSPRVVLMLSLVVEPFSIHYGDENGMRFLCSNALEEGIA
jgi:hypothetical protein